MDKGCFYFIKNEYFEEFKDPFLMTNKERVGEETHNRPCFYAFYEEKTKLFWMIPFSSKVDKFKKIYNDKISKYKVCDTIMFGNVLGHEKAFLLQNMCPIIDKYILNEYRDINNIPVRVEEIFEKELISKAKKVLTLYRKGIKLIFPNVQIIENKLVKLL
ncbi:MAG: hypothetical protein J6M39_08805 [Lachnospiraceae bacterium]|nr:hypothetical protein [Lachnospiraceae bacterium]